jgi:hypothetical protein
LGVTISSAGRLTGSCAVARQQISIGGASNVTCLGEPKAITLRVSGARSVRHGQG